MVWGREQNHTATLAAVKSPNATLSCGGGFFPEPRLKKSCAFNGNFMLPTQNYSVLIFKTDGSAVIYTDTEAPPAAEEAFQFKA